MQHRLLLAGLAGALFFAGCSDDTKDLNPGPPARVVERYPGGGTGGGAIDGKLAIFVEDDNSSLPLSGATVVIDAAGMSKTGMTGADGLAEFEGAEIKGPLAVHIFLTGYGFESYFGLNSSVATFGIGKLGAIQPVVPKTGTIKGNVTGWDLVMGTGAKIAQVTSVGVDLEDVTQMRRMVGPTLWPSNIAINAPPDTVALDYELLTDVRAKGVFLLAAPFDASGGFTPTHVGYSPGVTVVEGQTVMKDIAISHALDQTLAVSITGPTELDRASIAAAGFFANDGGLFLIGIETEKTATFRAPSLTGSLAGSSFLAYGTLSGEDEMGDEASVSVTQVSASSSIMLSAPNLPGKAMVMGRMFTTSGAVGADVHVFRILDANGGELWNLSVIGGVSATAPAVPAGFTDPMTGPHPVMCEALFFAPTVDLNNFRFSGLERSGSYGSSSRTRTITF